MGSTADVTVQDCKVGYVHHAGQLCIKCGEIGKSGEPDEEGTRGDPFVVNLAGHKSVLVRKRDPRGDLVGALKIIEQQILEDPTKVDKEELRAMLSDVMTAQPPTPRRFKAPGTSHARKRERRRKRR